MHICLPDTREVKPQHGSAYLLYNVHIDGLYHCSLRYKQLLHLHQALLKKFTHHQLPQFPPKKLLPLSHNQIEERRQQLEKYLQNISQDKAISNSSIFNLILLEAQRESTRIRQDQAHLDIELVNGQKIRLQVFTHDSADAVLTNICRALGLNDKYHAYFCLCLCGYDVIRDKLIIKRRLSFFESPYVTLQMAIQQQEQLQNVLTASNNNNNNNQLCNCCFPTTTTNNQSQHQQQQQQFRTPVSTAAVGRLTDNNCQCLSCLDHHNQQQQPSNLMAATTNDVPLVGSSSDLIINNINHIGHYNNNNYSHQNNHNNHHNNHQHHASNRTIHYPTNQNYHLIQSQQISNPTTTSSSSSSSSSSSTATATSSFVTHRILLRKSYWDPIYDTYILNDQQALNLLFIQTVYDIKHSLMFVDGETYHKLESLLATDSKLEYILLARTLKYYNYVHFEPCLSDYPRPRTKVMISIGSKELNMRVLKSPRSITNTKQQQQSNTTSTTNTTTTTTTTNTNTNTTAMTTTTTTAARTVTNCDNSLLAPSLSSSASTSVSSSPSTSSTTSSDVLSSSSAASTSTVSSRNSGNNNNNNNNTNHSTTNQQVKEQPSDQILYCTSSMVPSGYRHMITKNDLIEEEYNFKVPLIRCWRLTSLETLNSNSPAINTNTNTNNNNEFPLSAASNARRKTLSLFNSLSISNSNGSISSNNNNNNSNNTNPINHRQQERQQKQILHSDSLAQNGGTDSRANMVNHSGIGGSSLLAALVGSSNGYHRSNLPNHHHHHHHHQNSNNNGQSNSQMINNSNYQLAENQHRCSSIGGSIVQPFSQYELSFEYLISKDTLRWITISSDQAIFISISLQGVVDELVSKRDGNSSLYQNPTSPIDSATAASIQIMQAVLHQNPNNLNASNSNSSNNNNNNNNNNHHHQQQSFTYMYRDGRQKALNTNNQQLIDKFGTTLGYSPMNQNVLALARQRQQNLRANSSTSNSSFLSTTGSRFAFLSTSHPSDTNGNQHTSLEISHLKKAPSPIINDAFDGATNDDDL